MKLMGEIEIFGAVRFGVLEIHVDDDKLQGHVSRYGADRWQAYCYNAGKQKHLGYYRHRDDADNAARHCRNLAKFRKNLTRQIEGRVRRDDTGVWFVNTGHTAGSFGEAVLLHDVLARRRQRRVIVNEYEMPLGLLDASVYVELSSEPIFEPSDAEIKAYRRTVDELNNGTYDDHC